MLFNILLHGRDLVYNVGGCSRTTIHDLAKSIAACTGARVETPDIPPGEMALLNALAGAPDDVYMDIERYTEEFHKFFVPLSIGLDRTINYQRLLYEDSNNGC